MTGKKVMEMQVHERFRLNFERLLPLGRELLTFPPFLVEELADGMKKKGYGVFHSPEYWMGLPMSIVVVKNLQNESVKEGLEKIQSDLAVEETRLRIKGLFV